MLFLSQNPARVFLYTQSRNWSLCNVLYDLSWSGCTSQTPTLLPPLFHTTPATLAALLLKHPGTACCLPMLTCHLLSEANPYHHIKLKSTSPKFLPTPSLLSFFHGTYLLTYNILFLMYFFIVYLPGQSKTPREQNCCSVPWYIPSM